MKHQLPTWRYRICTRLASPLIALHLVWRSFRDGHWRYFKQRLGFVAKDTKPRIHIHAASVGEVMTVLPLIEHFQKNNNSPSFIVTTNTPTGASILKERLSGNATHAYLPLDFAGATKRFLDKQNIIAIWLVETEIWPWLFSRAKQSNIPLVIISARLSHKSQGKLAQFFSDTYSKALQNVSVLARSEKDAQRYIERGAQQGITKVVGNLKFAATDQPAPTQSLVDKTYVLAASTHDDEEIALARAWLKTSNTSLLVIAPRHAVRGAQLIKQLTQLQHELAPQLPTPARRSIGQSPSGDCRVYLADTLGELHHWYAHANIAFVGGSLINRGGHNVLEPARLSTAMIVGKYTDNFTDEVALLKAANAIDICDNAEQVIELMHNAVTSTTSVTGIGKRASAAVKDQVDILDKYGFILLEKLPS